jgi:hypothetical protein
MRIDVALRDTHRAERELAEELLRVGDRHATEQDVHHMTRTLAAFSREGVGALAEIGPAYGAELDSETDDEESSGPLAAVREKVAVLVGRRPEPGLLLLHDLRTLYLLASEASVNWVMLGQAAQAARDPTLLDLVSRHHPQTLRQARWALTRIREVAPQVLTA